MISSAIIITGSVGVGLVHAFAFRQERRCRWHAYNIVGPDARHSGNDHSAESRRRRERVASLAAAHWGPFVDKAAEQLFSSKRVQRNISLLPILDPAPMFTL